MSPAPPALVSERSLEVRRGRMAVRRDLRSGRRSLEDVLTDRPPCLKGVIVFELLGWRRGWGPDALRKVNAIAIREQINLALTVDHIGSRTIDWLIGLDRTTGVYAGNGQQSRRHELPS